MLPAEVNIFSERLFTLFFWFVIVAVELAKSNNSPSAGVKRQTYIPSVGLESFVFTLGQSRPLLTTEYEQAFSNYPQLRDMYNKKVWPDRSLDVEEIERVEAALTSIQTPRTEADVNSALSKFRKTILGLEKYRINNPGRVAGLYCDIIKTCIAVPDSWGAAANALEYAGLQFRDHVTEESEVEAETEVSVEPLSYTATPLNTTSEDEDNADYDDAVDDEAGGFMNSGDDMRCPTLSADSLWKQACFRLLDIDLTAAAAAATSTATATNADVYVASYSNGVDDKSSQGAAGILTTPSGMTSTTTTTTTASSTTWDQKYFSQIELTSVGESAIKDMMLSIVRVGVRCLLSREDVDAVKVSVSEYPLNPEMLPASSSVKVVLATDFKLLREDDGGGDDGTIFYVTNLDSPLEVFDPVDIFLKAMEESRKNG